MSRADALRGIAKPFSLRDTSAPPVSAPRQVLKADTLRTEEHRKRPVHLRTVDGTRW
jgi:hypothetical protein